MNLGKILECPQTRATPSTSHPCIGREYALAAMEPVRAGLSPRARAANADYPLLRATEDAATKAGIGTWGAC